MIEVTIFEATTDDPIKIVSFRNTKGFIIRESFYNPKNELVFEEMTEYCEKMKISRNVLFVSNDHKAIAYRNLYQNIENERVDKRSGYTDYKLKNGVFEKMSFAIYEYDENQVCKKCKIYDENDELYYSILFNEDHVSYIAKNGEAVADYYQFHEDIISKLETYESIKERLLDDAREKFRKDKG
ncbi:hypothetical protein [Acinetobacter bereziniae]|uniref:hypothetical protein n=1 Tax=Acinetobacter bereziniae TaxID=106648 RepID=UPI003AF5E495